MKKINNPRLKKAQAELSQYLQQHKDNTKETYYAMKPPGAKVLQELDERLETLTQGKRAKLGGRKSRKIRKSRKSRRKRRTRKY